MLDEVRAPLKADRLEPFVEPSLCLAIWRPILVTPPVAVVATEAETAREPTTRQSTSRNSDARSETAAAAHALVHGPYRLGGPRHGAPVRSFGKIALSTCR